MSRPPNWYLGTGPYPPHRHGFCKYPALLRGLNIKRFCQIFLTIRDLHPVHHIHMCEPSMPVEVTYKLVCQQTAYEGGDGWSSATDGNVCTPGHLPA